MQNKQSMNARPLKSKGQLFLLSLLLLCSPILQAQNILVNMAMLEGMDITPDNMFGFQIQSLETRDTRCRIEGTIRFRNGNHSIKYTFPYSLKPGLNLFTRDAVHPTWTYSSTALRELFEHYKVLPQGTYQYCVTVIPTNSSSEAPGDLKIDDCVYKQSEDLFSITLLEPENDAKLYEYNPLFSWVATYPFQSELSYRIRIAEIKEGQNTENAIARNNPIYTESNLMTTTMTYPMYGKPLKTWQPYAWTVDAYYKGILLGGAQPWKFTIVEDSLNKTLPKASSYIDMNMDKGAERYYAVGNIKLRYSENDFLQNELKVKFFLKGKEVKDREFVWKVNRGVNFNTHELEDFNIKHKEDFEVIIEYKNAKTSNHHQKIQFKYVDPNLVK
ncbi:MAG TPA: hypothetical protein VL098_08550 [Flavipsychrobacter sp.]|nr:hypothetical protein [Flavipsychrobacter sp.]